MLRFAILLLVVAAAAPTHAQTVDPVLAGATWRVVEVEGARPPNPETLQFGDHRVTGQGPCNRFAAGFKQSGQAVEIGQPVATRIYCQGRMDAERQYFDALHASRSYALNEGALSLNAADGHTLIRLAK